MKRLILLLLAAAGVLAACGGGGGGSAPLPAPAGGGARGQTTQAQLAVFIPRTTSANAGRAPQFISPGTAQLGFLVESVDGASPSPAQKPFIVSITDPRYCSATTSGTTCNVAVPVPIAKAVVIAIETLDANGAVLGFGTTAAIDTTQPTIPQQKISLGGLAAKIVLTEAADAAFDDGNTHQIALAVSAQDASGNTIIATQPSPQPYTAPISLSISNDPNNALSLSTATISAPGTSGGITNVTLRYDSSKPLTSQAVITAQSGSANDSVLFAPLVVSPQSITSLAAGGSSGSFSISEPGYGGAFNVVAPSFVTASCTPSNCTPTAPGGTVTIAIAPNANGTGNVTIADLSGASAAIPIEVAQTNGGGTVVGAPYPIYEYTTASAGGNYGITASTSGNAMWFVDRVNASLGYVLDPASCNGTTCKVGEIGGVPGAQIPPAALQSIAAGPDGKLYVTDLGNYSTDLGTLYQITCSDTTGTCSSGSSPASFGPVATPAPADVKIASNGVLYATSAYATTQPTIPTAGDSNILTTTTSTFGNPIIALAAAPDPSRPAFLAEDALDGNMWFTDTGNGNVGFFPLSCLFYCTITEEPGNTVVFRGGIARRPFGGASSALPTPLAGIVSAPDGYLYVAAPGAHAILRINPATWTSCSGALCTYQTITLTNPSAAPEELTIGSDGNVWFTDTSGYIGMIPLASCATTCVTREFAVPTAGSAPWGIASGPDGNIWFSESKAPKVGEVVLQ